MHFLNYKNTLNYFSYLLVCLRYCSLVGVRNNLTSSELCSSKFLLVMFLLLFSSTFHPLTLLAMERGGGKMFPPSSMVLCLKKWRHFIWMDNEALSRVRMKFWIALFGKLFCKPPSFNQLKIILQTKWSEIDIFHIADHQNGYLLIRCETQKAMQWLLFDSSWAANGVIF